MQIRKYDPVVTANKQGRSPWENQLDADMYITDGGIIQVVTNELAKNGTNLE